MKTPPTTHSNNHHIKHNRALNNMMDVTFVLEESGVTATVEVPCEAKVAAAKEVACTALALSPASVEMRIGTQVLEGTCRLQDTAFCAGVQVVLACPRFADIKCPAEYSAEPQATSLTLSRCGTLCIHSNESGHVGGFDTETFDTVFSFKVDKRVRRTFDTDFPFEVNNFVYGPPAISQCKTRCYLACGEGLFEVALPNGEVVRKVDGTSYSVFARGSVVVSRGKDGVSVYDEDLTLLRSLSHEGRRHVAVSDCGGWVITSSWEERIRLWDVNTGVAVVCVPGVARGSMVALSRSASVFAVEGVGNTVHLYDWSGAALRSVDVARAVQGMQFTPCGKYLVVRVVADDDEEYDPYAYRDFFQLHQYDVATMSCVRVLPPQSSDGSFAISPCSRVVVAMRPDGVIVTKHLYPHNVVEEDFWKKDSVVARDMLLHEHGIDVASPLPACSYPSSTFEYHLEHILKNDNPDQLDLLLRSKLDGSTGVTLQSAVQCAAHRCVDVMLDGFERSPDDTAHALRSSASHCWGHEDTPGKVLCVLRILRHCREQGVVVDQPQILQDTFKGLISSSAAHPKLCQLLMRMGAAVTSPSVIGASRVNSVFRGNSEGPLCESPCNPGCRCITCLDEERYTERRFCLGGGGGGWRKAPAVVRAQRKARIAQQMSRAAQRCRRQR